MRALLLPTCSCCYLPCAPFFALLRKYSARFLPSICKKLFIRAAVPFIYGRVLQIGRQLRAISATSEYRQTYLRYICCRKRRYVHCATRKIHKFRWTVQGIRCTFIYQICISPLSYEQIPHSWHCTRLSSFLKDTSTEYLKNRPHGWRLKRSLHVKFAFCTSLVHLHVVTSLLAYQWRQLWTITLVMTCMGTQFRPTDQNSCLRTLLTVSIAIRFSCLNWDLDNCFAYANKVQLSSMLQSNYMATDFIAVFMAEAGHSFFATIRITHFESSNHNLCQHSYDL